MKRIYYATGNGLNGEKSLAYNMKVYHVIRPELRNQAYEILANEALADEVFCCIGSRIADFERETGYKAGFNGRQGGYLVLYRPDGTIRGLDESEVPTPVKRAFAKLARDIVKIAEWYCRKPVENKTITIQKQIKAFAE